jgi:hypothetical protein
MSDVPECGPGHGYGDSENDTGARYKVEISVADYTTYCGCDLGAETHFTAFRLTSLEL